MERVKKLINRIRDLDSGAHHCECAEMRKVINQHKERLEEELKRIQIHNLKNLLN